MLNKTFHPQVDRGARFGSLISSGSNATTLYIDLNGWREKPEVDDKLDVKGFATERIFFVTNGQQEVPLLEVRESEQ